MQADRLAGLGIRLKPGVPSSSDEDAFRLLLCSCIGDVCEATLPEGIGMWTGVTLQGWHCVEVLEVVDVANPPSRETTAEGSRKNRTLKLLLTDGATKLVAMEYRRIAAFDGLHAGCKLAVGNGLALRRGLALLEPCNVSVLGGSGAPRAAPDGTGEPQASAGSGRTDRGPGVSGLNLGTAVVDTSAGPGSVGTRLSTPSVSHPASPLHARPSSSLGMSPTPPRAATICLEPPGAPDLPGAPVLPGAIEVEELSSGSEGSSLEVVGETAPRIDTREIRAYIYASKQLSSTTCSVVLDDGLALHRVYMSVEDVAMSQDKHGWFGLIVKDVAGTPQRWATACRVAPDHQALGRMLEVLRLQLGLRS
mmetsp:Transcript_11133/g.26542  ORF Transcript_11133/g.26542 Transcript_11133/m.26542 type:complete len:364 (+) Transcript_11133:17-1108(+)